MKFYNRAAELQELQALDQSRPSFLVITGKRRVGKTELILQFLKGKGFYFFVDDKKSEKMLVQEFYEEVLKKGSLPAYVTPPDSFERFLPLLMEFSGKESVVFDEFQRFLKVNPSIINQFQKYWDLQGKKSQLFLIASGSSVGMIKRIFVEGGAPLFKRADNLLSLEPFSFGQIQAVLRDLGIENFEEQLKLYFLFGGVIYYYRLLEKYQVKSFSAAVEQLLLREFAPLKEEIKDTLIESFGKEHRTYYEILNALAQGKNTKKEMADLVQVEETSLSPYLSDLKELVKVVDYDLPVTEDPLRSKKGRYFISDCFFYFWFRFIFRYRSYYEQKNFSFISSIISGQQEAFRGRAYELFCREMLLWPGLQKMLPFTLERSGRWWGHYRDSEGKRQELEIDLCALNEQTKEILFGECKWRENVDAAKILQELRQKARYVPWHQQQRKEYYALFAKSFKTKKMLEKNVCLFDLKDLEKIIKRNS